MAARAPPVEALRKRFEIDIGGVDDAEEFGARPRRYVAGRRRDRLDPMLATGFGDVDGIFEINGRVIVGKDDAVAAERDSRAGDLLGRSGLGLRFGRAISGKVKGRATGAAKIAARRPERQRRRAGKKVKERRRLDRFDAEAKRIARQRHAAIDVSAHETMAALAGADVAHARTDLAKHAGLGERPGVVIDEAQTGRPSSFSHRPHRVSRKLAQPSRSIRWRSAKPCARQADSTPGTSA